MMKLGLVLHQLAFIIAWKGNSLAIISYALMKNRKKSERNRKITKNRKIEKKNRKIEENREKIEKLRNKNRKITNKKSKNRKKKSKIEEKESYTIFQVNYPSHCLMFCNVYKGGNFSR